MIRKLLVKILSAYGAWTANEASFHGSYEPNVPNSLKKN